MRWRVGRKVPRNIYRDGEPIAMLATPEIAAELVEGMNERERLREAAWDVVNNARDQGRDDCMDDLVDEEWIERLRMALEGVEPRRITTSATPGEK